MNLETFDDVLHSIKKNTNRPYHLLLGNGFSMAYDPAIFSYNALHNFITNLDDEDLTTILGVIETKNFELIMQQLDTFSNLIEAFGGANKLKSKIDQASKKLKNSLLEAVKALHPEHVYKVPEESSMSCSYFLKTFLDTGGRLFSTNYDLLLYWILMRSDIVSHVDGFGRDLENEGEFVPEEEQEWSELRWGKHKEAQNVFYVHGALPLFDAGTHIVKEEYDLQNYLLENISKRMSKGHYPIFVTAGSGKEKVSHIMHNPYLCHCYESLSSITGSLVSFGFNFGPYDEHIIDAINRATKFNPSLKGKLLSVYIGVYSEEDQDHIETIASKFKCKVRIYDAKSANIWGMPPK